MWLLAVGCWLLTDSRFFLFRLTREARAVRAHKTLTPRVTDFFTDLEEKTDCFAV